MQDVAWRRANLRMDQHMLTLTDLSDLEMRLRDRVEELIEETLRLFFWPAAALVHAIKLKRPPSI